MNKARPGISRLVAGSIHVVLVVSASVGIGCGGGSSPEPPGFHCFNGAKVPANTVGLRCGGTLPLTTKAVTVVLQGPTSGATAFRGFAFDIVYDWTKVQFVPDSSYTSPTMPGALIVVAPAGGVDGRLVIGLDKPGNQLQDYSVGPGSWNLLTLKFRRVAQADFDPTPLNFENVQAIGASTAIQFNSTLSLSYN